jgi:hypothetical protein
VNLTLKRVASSDRGTFGVLLNGSTPLCVTAERPWLNNQKDVSCVPVGVYKCVQHNGAKFKGVWQVTNVPNRDAILIHAGNNPIKETEGCILVGRSFSPFGVLSSQLALDDLRHALPAEFNLTIKEA